MSNSHFKILPKTLKANANHDPLTGQFTSGGGSMTRDREDVRTLTERKEAQQERSARRQPSSGTLILPEQQAREQGQSVNQPLDVGNQHDMQNAAKETAGSRVFTFSQGEGSDLDRNVRFVTNTNKAGAFERGALRVEIHNPETQKREIFQRGMSELPKLVAQVLNKQYTPIAQHRRNTAHFVKADMRRILPNPMHTATPAQVETCKTAIASIPEADFANAKTITVELYDLISIQSTIDDDKVNEMVAAGMAELAKAPLGLVLQYDDETFLIDGNHRAIAFERLGETSMEVRSVAYRNTQKAVISKVWGNLAPLTEEEIEALSHVEPGEIDAIDELNDFLDAGEQ